MNANSKPFALSLQTLISAVLIASIVLVSTFLITRAYISQKALLIDASSRTALQLAEGLDAHMSKLAEPLYANLRVLTQTPITTSTSHEERILKLGILTETLNSHPILDSVYIGFEDGSFFLVRDLDEVFLRNEFAAPDTARYLIQSIERTAKGDRKSAVWEFYDDQLTRLERHEKPDYSFDPRQRSWYRSATQQAGQSIFTAPYVFYTTRELGITMARQTPNRSAVIGFDASIQDLSVQLGRLQSNLTLGSEVAVVDEQGQVIIYPDTNELIQLDAAGDYQLASINNLSSVPLTTAYNSNLKLGVVERIEAANEQWYAMRIPMNFTQNDNLQLLNVIPASALLAYAKKTVITQVSISVAITLLLLFIFLTISRTLLKPFKQLSSEVAALTNFNFNHPIQTRSRIIEINNLCQVLSRMATTIAHFQEISHTLSHEKDVDKMLRETALHLKECLGAEKILMYIYEEQRQGLELTAEIGLAEPVDFIPCAEDTSASKQSALEARLPYLADTSSGWVTTALLDRDTYCVGFLSMRLPEEQLADSNLTDTTALSNFLKELSGSAATAVDIRKQIEIQRNLIDSIIQILADAIDAKSAYTSGHCERVPILAESFVDHVQASTAPAFADFHMNDTQRYEFKIAAWMHDCGKVISPEHIVDKATKLETIYNRIHEIRTRFEVLWRDADIAYYQGLISGRDEPELAQQRQQRQQQLQDDFSRVAAANIGGEFMSDEAIAELDRIGQQEWLRHFDNSLGLSRDERERLATTGQAALPAVENLLADRPDHLVHWQEGRRPPVEKDDPRNIWGFDMTLPEHSLNLGEIHNLSTRRGTLSPEDRFKVNEHIVQTICMLSRLPLPQNLKRVPDIAGNHHEKMDGTGYPRKLAGKDMSIPERIMAIADIFEALTAPDRPYKDAKTLEESLRIMALMAKDQHIDMELFEFFIEEEVYAEYVQRFMLEKQMTPINKAQILELAKS